MVARQPIILENGAEQTIPKKTNRKMSNQAIRKEQLNRKFVKTKIKMPDAIVKIVDKL